MTNSGCAPQNCTCFCPTADLPIAPVLVAQGGPGAVIEITIYGTQAFGVNIISNPILPVTLLPLIASAQILNGNILTITTTSPNIAETIGTYNAQVQVTNACGQVTIDLSIEVVADIAPIVSDCLLAQQLWIPEARVPNANDLLLAFTPLGCRALTPPPDVCTALLAFPGAAPAAIDTVFGQQGGACVEFTLLDVVQLYDLCANLNGLPLGALPVPADTFVTMQAGNCAQVTLAQITVGVIAALDICAILQNLPNAVVQPTAVFYGQQGGNCFEFSVSDLLALAVPACPLLASCDGSCAAPAYSFASSPSSGMWFDPALGPSGAVVISDNNCANQINVGASIEIRSAASHVIAMAGTPTSQGARLELFDLATLTGLAALTGANSAPGFTAGAAFLSGGFDGLGLGGGGVFIVGGNSVGSSGGTIQITAGGGTSGGHCVVTGGGPNGTFLVQGWQTISLNDLAAARVILDSGTVRIDTSSTVRWLWNPNGSVEVGGSAGGVGMLLTSMGAGAPPVWAIPAPVSVPLNSVQNATGSAVRNHGTNTIRWEWNGGIAGPAFTIRGSNGGFIPFSTLFQIDDDGLGAYDSLLKVTAFGTDILNLASNPGTVLRGFKSKQTFVEGGDADGSSPSGNLTLRGGLADIGLQPPGGVFIQGGDVTFVGNPNPGADVTMRGGHAFGTGTGGNVFISSGTPLGGGTQGVVAIASSGLPSLVAGIDLHTNSQIRMAVPGLSILLNGTGGGELQVNANPGVAAQVLTSNGPGVAPSWQNASTSFPLLAPDGSCAAPSYSFTSSPDSGMFYDPAGVGSVVIGDDNCADSITIGASINITSSASTVSVNAGTHIVLGAVTGDILATGGSSGTGTGGALILQAPLVANEGGIARLSGGGVGGGGSGIGGDVIVSGGGGPVNFGSVRLQSGGGSLQDEIVVSFGSVSFPASPATFASGALFQSGLTVQADNATRFTSQTSGAGASVGTLTNAPSAGDPAFWLRVVINGANRFIPVWA